MKKLLILIISFSLLPYSFAVPSRMFKASGTQNLSAGAVNDVTTGNLTIIAYVKMNETAATGVIVGKRRAANLATQPGFVLWHDSSDHFNVTADDGVVNLSCASTNDLDGTWVQLAMEWVGSSDSMRLYENRVLACQPLATAVGSLTNGFSFEVGNTGTNSEPMSGLIAHVSFARAIPSANELQELAINPTAVFAGLAIQNKWGLWGQPGSTEKDLMTNRDLTSTSVDNGADGPPIMLPGSPQ